MLGLKVKYDAAQYEGESYQYDINGNRKSALIQGLEKKYETGKFNRLLSENGEKLEYDAEGNRIAKGDVKYEWDHRNRLVKVETPQETIEYTYDYQNRLVKRSVGENITHFIHDGWHIVRQCENGKPIKRFLWGTKQDELLCDNDNWTLGDHLNTVRDVINTDGKVIAHCDYNAFGKCLSPLKDLSFAYTGKMTDSATGLQWNINRWYDANAGRWISEDPIGFVSFNTNLNNYVKNVLVCTDYLGLLDTTELYLGGFHLINNLNIQFPNSNPTSLSLGGYFGFFDQKYSQVGTVWYHFQVSYLVLPDRITVPGKCVYRIRFSYINSFLVGLVRPQTTVNDRLVWSDLLQKYGRTQVHVMNHEKHHYLTHDMAVITVNAALLSLEAVHFDKYIDATNAANNYISRANNVFSAAAIHSKKYDSNPQWNADSFNPPLSHQFNPTF